MPPNNSPDPGAQPIPVYAIDEAEVEKAYQAYIRLRMDAADCPDLAENEYFTALQDTAFARFFMLFEELQ